LRDHRCCDIGYFVNFANQRTELHLLGLHSRKRGAYHFAKVLAFVRHLKLSRRFCWHANDKTFIVRKVLGTMGGLVKVVVAKCRRSKITVSVAINTVGQSISDTVAVNLQS
jgi:uncharacterized membrane protein